ncbi:CU044_5270 family protein [Amycolatopsis sp. NPDC089917]|uniref:CU044_5270 family protein n=1 Tax=Amycolatopsis sp. NPDC089917 TaxID=3155187 RepID=UPI0034443697
MHGGSIRKVWSEAELDEALADLHAEPGTRQDELARAKAALLRAAGEVEDEPLTAITVPATKRPAAWRWIAAAAAAALVSGGGIVATNAFTGGGPAPADHAVLAPDDDVLEALHGDNFPLRDDQYRLVTESTWTTRVTKTGLVYQTHEILERWLPVPSWKPTKTRFTGTGEIRWIKGDYKTAQALGEALPGPSSSVTVDNGPPAPTTTISPPPPTTAPPLLPPRNRLPSESGWTEPTTEFLGELPVDPSKMAERLLHDGIWRDRRPREQPNSPDEMFEMAFNVLRSSQGFGAQRVALCKALAQVSGITGETVTTPDGRRALSYSIVLPNQTRTFLVDVATAAVVGSRAVRPSTPNEEWPGLTLFDTKISVTITNDGGP